MILKTRYVGICPVCEGEFRLHSGGLVHHGYRRPGHGSIVGDCFAVGYEPYEVSTRGCTDYLAVLTLQRSNLEAYLGRLKAGKVRVLSVEIFRGFNRPMEEVKVYADSTDPQEVAKYKRQLEQEIGLTEGRIKGHAMEQDRMEKLITNWVLKPIRTFEEAAAETNERTRVEREARQAEAYARRTAKKAKADALKAKRDAWEAEKQALIAKYREKFEQFAASPEGATACTASAQWAWAEMNRAKAKKGYLDFAERHLGCNEALIKLGLAKVVERPNGPSVQYADRDGMMRW